MSYEVVIKELRAVIGIEAQKREREVLFDIFDLFQDSSFSLSPDGTLFSPSGGDINGVEGIGEHTRGGFTAMGNGISFEEPRSGFIPLVGLNGYLFFQEASRFCCCPSPFVVVDTGWCEDTVYGCRRYGQECLRDIRGKRSELCVISGYPEGEDGFQSFRAGEICGKPDSFEGCNNLIVLVPGFWSSFLRIGFCKPFESLKDSYGMFAVTVAGGTELIQDGCFFTARGLFIPETHCLTVLLLGSRTHDQPSFRKSMFGNITL